MFDDQKKYGFREEPKKYSRFLSKRAKIFAIIFFVPLAALIFTIAINDVSVTGIVDFELLTADTAAPTTILASGGGQVSIFDVQSNYIDITLDNLSTVTFNTTAPNEFFRVNWQAGSSDYTITPSCPTTTVTLTGTGATAVLRLEVYTADICPAGGTSHVFPFNYSININNGAATTTTRDVTLNLAAQNAVQVIVSNNANFSGADWEPFSNPENKSWTLTLGAGEKNVYAIYKSITGDLSPIISDSIELLAAETPAPPEEEPTPPEEEPAPEETTEPTPPILEGGCTVDCQKVTYELYIKNPNGTTRLATGIYAKRTDLGNGVEEVAFEDSASDMDFNDVLVTVDHSDCGKIVVKVTEIDAAWHHQVKIRLYYGGIFKEDSVVFSDSHSVVAREGKTISFLDRTSLCEEVKGYITVYQHINYRGRFQNYYVGENIQDLRNQYIGDEVISSVKIFGDASLQAFSGYNYEGDMEIFSADDPDLRNNPIKQDTISSLKVISKTAETSDIVGDSCKANIVFTVFMQLGDANGQVLELQKVLRCLGYIAEVTAANGVFGQTTETAVKQFQAARGISPLGYVGPATRQALNNL